MSKCRRLTLAAVVLAAVAIPAVAQPNSIHEMQQPDDQGHVWIYLYRHGDPSRRNNTHSHCSDRRGLWRRKRPLGGLRHCFHRRDVSSPIRHHDRRGCCGCQSGLLGDNHLQGVERRSEYLEQCRPRRGSPHQLRCREQRKRDRWLAHQSRLHCDLPADSLSPGRLSLAHNGSAGVRLSLRAPGR